MEDEANITVLEPKYCGLCGGLWLRRADAGSDCCPNCRALDSELALARRAREEARSA